MPNGVVTQYQVMSGLLPTANVTEQLAIVSGLNVSTMYLFNIRAWTIIGPGQPASLQASTAFIREYDLIQHYIMYGMFYDKTRLARAFSIKLYRTASISNPHILQAEQPTSFDTLLNQFCI